MAYQVYNSNSVSFPVSFAETNASRHGKFPPVGTVLRGKLHGNALFMTGSLSPQAPWFISLSSLNYFFINFYWQYQLSVVSILTLFFILSPVPSLFLYFLNVCNSYNRSLLKMYVVAYETSSKTGNFLLDHALSMDNVCNRLLFSIPSF